MSVPRHVSRRRFLAQSAAAGAMLAGTRVAGIPLGAWWEGAEDDLWRAAGPILARIAPPEFPRARCRRYGARRQR
ncbi:MAG TPA: twin-arginine translocation signal domain-containing protein [Vicinamibacterales bacterium]|nr:twin-arginine translocation signal domain-containing protein [Vicinamibacterales bacterium]